MQIAKQLKIDKRKQEAPTGLRSAKRADLAIFGGGVAAAVLNILTALSRGKSM